MVLVSCVGKGWAAVGGGRGVGCQALLQCCIFIWSTIYRVPYHGKVSLPEFEFSWQQPNHNQPVDWK